MKPILLGARESGGAFHLDLDQVLRSRLLIQGGSGSGKSWLVRRIAEQAFGRLPVIIIDPEGEFSTLREKFGYVLIGAGGETPADTRSAALVAHKLLELHASAVCDLYEMHPAKRHEWVRDFLNAMIDAPKTLWQPVLVIVDEGHLFAPEKGEAPSVAAEAMMNMSSRGRKRGFALVVATQRLAKLSNNVAAELQNVLLGLTTIEADQDRAIRALGMSKSKETQSFAADLARLNEGQFWAFGRALTLQRERIQVGGILTSHPKAGDTKHASAPPPAPEKVKALLPKLADLPQQAEQKALTEKELRTQIRSLESKVKSLEQSPAKHSVSGHSGSKSEVKTVEILTDADRTHLKELRDELLVFSENIADKADQMLTSIAERAKAEIDTALGKWTADVDKRRALFADRLERPRLLKILTKLEKVSAPPTPASLPPHHPAQTPVARSLPPRTEGRSSPGARPAGGGADLAPGERKILTAVAQFGTVDRGQLTVLVGYKATARDTYISRLAQKGLVESGQGTVRVTQAGVDALGQDFEPLPTGDALLAFWRGRLPSGEVRVLDAIVSAHPASITRNELGEATGYKATARDTYISRLASRRLVVSDGRGSVMASGELFS